MTGDCSCRLRQRLSIKAALYNPELERRAPVCCRLPRRVRKDISAG